MGTPSGAESLIHRKAQILRKANAENFTFGVYSKKYFGTLKIEYSARSVRSTERERGMLAPGWPLWPERFHNDPRGIPSATGISPP